MYCTLGFAAINAAIFSSAKPPLTSFTYVAPAAIACLATSDLVVSILTTAPSFTISVITGITRFNSSSSVTLAAPGRVDSPPTSMMSAPSAINLRAWAIASFESKNFPPSAKESGVTFKIPNTKVRSMIYLV